MNENEWFTKNCEMHFYCNPIIIKECPHYTKKGHSCKWNNDSECFNYAMKLQTAFEFISIYIDRLTAKMD